MPKQMGLCICRLPVPTLRNGPDEPGCRQTRSRKGQERVRVVLALAGQAAALLAPVALPCACRANACRQR